mmetsp:Transcript_56842/g.102075  ORF Transcript_56842/g.102075 Transcript_56842/m.102075 type:complete len:97 (+) Transcript_56842:296-586(+)
MAGAVSANPFAPAKEITDEMAKNWKWPICHDECQGLCTEVLGPEPGYCDILCISCTYETPMDGAFLDPRTNWNTGSLIIAKNIKLQDGKRLSSVLF